MTKGCGIGVEMFGETKGDLVKPGLTKAQLEEIESRKGQVLEGPDPFGDVFAESKSGMTLSTGKTAPAGPLPVGLKRQSPPRKKAPKGPEGPKEPVFERLDVENFDGTVGTAVDVPHEPVMNPAGSFSVDFYAQVAPGGTGYRSPLTSRDMPPPRGYSFFVTPKGFWAFWVGVPEAQAWLKTEGPKAKEGEFQRITGVYDADERTIQLFVDGAPAPPTRASSLEPPVLTNVFAANEKRPLRLGAGATEQEPAKAKFPFNGSVRDVRIYARALASPLPETVEGEPAAKKQKVES